MLGNNRIHGEHGAFMHNFRAQLAIGAVCLVLGFTVTLHMKSVRWNASAVGNQLKRNEDLQQELNSLHEVNNDLITQIYQLKSDLDMYRNEASESSGYAKVLTEQLTRSELLAGLSAVQGPGIIITMNDSKAKGDTAEDYLIHESDIRGVVNELYAAGAEVICINEDRLISTSSIRCVGPVVMVNGNKHAPPYVIKAVGAPDTLEAALNMRGGVLEPLRNYFQLEIDIKKEKMISIPRFNGVVTFKYAEEAPKEIKQ